jgi:hypothetical protein
MIDAAMLSRFCRVPAGDVRKLIAELRKAEVFSVTESGVIFSRKMVRDEAKSQRAKEAGRQGGNPRLTGKGVAPPGPSGLSEGLTARVKPHWHLASGLSKKGTTYQEEALGDDGPFTGGEAA